MACKMNGKIIYSSFQNHVNAKMSLKQSCALCIEWNLTFAFQERVIIDHGYL